MKRAWSLIPIAVVLTLALIFGFNNCSGVNFETSPELIQQEQLEFSSHSRIVINGGAAFTNLQQVQLSLESPRAQTMKISRQKDCGDGQWETYSTAMVWTLTNKNSLSEVYAQFRDLRNDISPCVKASIVHDSEPPSATYSQATGGITKDATHLVRWKAEDNLSGVESTMCTIPQGVQSACADQFSILTNHEGSNEFRIRLTDKAGNQSKEFVYTWLLDKTAPVVTVNSGPAPLTGSVVAAFNYGAIDSGSGIESLFCRIDGGAYQSCSSTSNYTGLTNGPHRFEIYASDRAGNISTTINANWTVDLTAPSLRFTETPPSVSGSVSGTFEFNGEKSGQPISIFECSKDSGAFARCNSPFTVNELGEGVHHLEVRGIDSLGNVSTPIAYYWTVDLTRPQVTITSGPPPMTNVNEAHLQWTTTDGLSGIKLVECQIDGSSFQPCAGGAISLSGLLEGPHSFQVRSTDHAGHSATATHHWTLDLTLPVLSITAGPAPFVKDNSTPFVFNATDASGILQYECRIDQGSFTACTSPFTAVNLLEGGHVFYVRATDRAGNVSPSATRSWDLDLSPPIIRIISVPVTIKEGDAAKIQYAVLDLASGLNTVRCGLVGHVVDCATSATLDLGSLPEGSYTWEIQASDQVGNSLTDRISFQVGSRPKICDPFAVGGDALCNGGLVGDIYYLDSAGVNGFWALAQKTVDFFYTNGIKVEAQLNLNQLFVSTRAFDAGFPMSTGDLIKDNSGNTLMSYFAFKLKTILKLDALNDQPGWYQFATLSDDGSMVLMTPQGGANASVLVSNDGDHSTRMGCSTQAVYIDDTTRLGLEIKYYQGPPVHIAMVMLWKRVNGPTAARDESCGTENSNLFFGPPPYTDFTTGLYGQLVGRGWRVVAPANLVAPVTY